MPWVERDQGVVTGIFNRRQDGYAEEFLASNHADVVAYLNPPQPDVTTTPMILEDLARLAHSQFTTAQINAAKRNRGDPMPT